MNLTIKAILLILISTQVTFAQKEKPLYSFCGKTGSCTMTWDEFTKCKKELVPEKGVSIGSYVLTIQKAEKKDTVQIEYVCKGNAFSKQANESIEKLHKDKKMGSKVLIEGVEVLQSGKESRKVPGMIIILN
jgi:hypothetical protein